MHYAATTSKKGIALIELRFISRKGSLKEERTRYENCMYISDDKLLNMPIL